jgi:integrase
MRPNEPIQLTWDRIDEKAGLIRLKAEDVKEKALRNVPISGQLRAIFRNCGKSNGGSQTLPLECLRGMADQ